MAHEIVNEQIAFANEVPWHGLGAEVSADAPIDEWVKAAKLDWEVNPFPMYVEGPNGPIETNKAGFIRSTDQKVMTIAGQDWKPLQNRDALEFMQRYVTAGAATMETVGALRDGQVVWGLARLNHTFNVRRGDKVAGYIMITSPHTAGQAIKVQTTSVRVVCANTMAMSNRVADIHYRQSHRNDFDVEMAAEAVAVAHEEFAAAERRFKTLDKIKLAMEDAVVKALVPVFAPGLVGDKEAIANIMDPDVMPKQIAGIVNSIENSPGAINDTAWGVLNGATHYFDHEHGRSQETRFASGQTGWARGKKLQLEKVLMELA